VCICNVPSLQLVIIMSISWSFKRTHLAKYRQQSGEQTCIPCNDATMFVSALYAFAFLGISVVLYKFAGRYY